MRRYRRRRSLLQVSLFPFLAVLICTVGVLIVMLVIAVKSAESTAVETATVNKDEFETERARLESELETEELRVEGLKALRPDVLERMTDIRTLRGHLEQEIRKLNWDSELLAQQYKAAEQQKREEDRDQQVAEQEEQELDREIEKLKSFVELAEKQLEDERTYTKPGGPVTYSIVPVEGAGGTGRRPIYVECAESGITLQPFGILLGAADLQEPFPPGNPLDAALLAIREYWQRYDLAGEEGAPYPLLIVRPDGAHSYTAARHAMKSWDDEFGYELVDDGKPLDFGDIDTRLKTEIETAIAQARVRQQYAITNRNQRSQRGVSVGRPGGRSQRPGLVVSGSQGGFINSDGSPARNYVQQAGGSGSSGTSIQQAGFNNQASTFTGEHGSSAAMQTSYVQTDPGGANASGSGSNGGAANVEKNEYSASGTSSSSAEGSLDIPTPGDVTDDAANQMAGSPNNQQKTSPRPAIPSSSCDCIADSRGEQWALPSRTPGATGYLRPVRIHCSANSMTIQSSGTTDVVINFQGETATAIGPLVEEIWQMIDAWGSAGSRAYWKPELRISIAADGYQRVADLNRLLDRSGLSLQEAR